MDAHLALLSAHAPVQDPVLDAAFRGILTPAHDSAHSAQRRAERERRRRARRSASAAYSSAPGGRPGRGAPAALSEADEGDNPIPPKLVEHLPLRDDDWGPVDPVADKACFLCDTKEEPGRGTATYYQKLVGLFGGDVDGPLHKRCTTIQRYYNDHFRAAQGGRAWTLRAIKRHAVGDCGLNPRARLDVLLSNAFEYSQLIADTCMVERVVGTTELRPDPQGAKLFRENAKLFLQLLAARERMG